MRQRHLLRLECVGSTCTREGDRWPPSSRVSLSPDNIQLYRAKLYYSPVAFQPWRTSPTRAGPLENDEQQYSPPREADLSAFADDISMFAAQELLALRDVFERQHSFEEHIESHKRYVTEMFTFLHSNHVAICTPTQPLPPLVTFRWASTQGGGVGDFGSPNFRYHWNFESFKMLRVTYHLLLFVVYIFIIFCCLDFLYLFFLGLWYFSFRLFCSLIIVRLFFPSTSRWWRILLRIPLTSRRKLELELIALESRRDECRQGCTTRLSSRCKICFRVQVSSATALVCHICGQLVCPRCTARDQVWGMSCVVL